MSREWHREYQRKWRAINKEKLRAKKLRYRSKPGVRAKEAAYEAKRRQRSLTRFLSDVLKAAPCSDCAGRFPAQVMEFDHRDPTTKIADPAVLARQPVPSKLLTEISKCDLVCANCHRIRTINRHLNKQFPSHS